MVLLFSKIGSTLKSSSQPIILWSVAEGLFKSNAAVENVEYIIKKREIGPIEFTDITWLNDLIFLVTNNTQVYWFNITNQMHGRIVDMDSVGSIAVDWIGKKLYWSCPKQQLVSILQIYSIIYSVKADSENKRNKAICQ